MAVQEVTNESISLSWQPPLEDGGSPLTGYVVDKYDEQYGGWTRATKLPADTTECTVGNLVKGHNYNFRVYAENKIGVSQPIELKEAVRAKSAIGNILMEIK